MSRARVVGAAGAAAAVIAVAGCGQRQFFGPPAPPALRPKPSAGPACHAEAAYLAAHPVKMPAGMQAGILVAFSGPGYACLNGLCRTWQGTVIIAGGPAGQLSSEQGDHGVAQLASPGGQIEFPAADAPTGAASDDGTSPAAKVLAYGAVPIS